MSEYQWKEYGQSFAISNNQPKVYGPVHLKSGRKIYRNYGRELKNGKGIALVDLFVIRTLENRLRMDMELMSRVFA